MFTYIAIAVLAILVLLQTDIEKIKGRIKLYKYSRKGVKFIDPSSVYIEDGVEIGSGTTIHPNVYLYSGTRVGKNCTIYPENHIFSCKVGDNVKIWPGTSLVHSAIGAGSQIHKDIRITDSVLGALCRVEGGSKVKGSSIGAHAYIDNASIERSQIGPNCVIKDYSKLEEITLKGFNIVGPHAHIHGGSVLEEGSRASHGEVYDTLIGRMAVISHVQLIRSVIGEATKAKHFGYIGDATIGKHCNIGAGTVFCNYDGSEKHKTILEDGAFVGSGTMLIAPLTLGEQSFTAAGSVVSRDVEANDLVIERGQTHKHHPDSGKGEGRITKKDAVRKDKDGWHY